jgi:hypothetical protein
MRTSHSVLIVSLFLTSCGQEEVRLELGEKLQDVIQSNDRLKEQTARLKEQEELVDHLRPLALKNSHDNFLEAQRDEIRAKAGCLKDEWSQEDSSRQVSSQIREFDRDSAQGPWRVIHLQGNCVGMAELRQGLADSRSIEFELLKGDSDRAVSIIQRDRNEKPKPLMISAKHFRLNENDVLKTNGRDLIIFAEKVQILGTIDTQPKRPREFDHGQNAGNIFIKASLFETGSKSVLRLDGGEAYSPPEPVTREEYFRDANHRNKLKNELMSRRRVRKISLSLDDCEKTASDDCEKLASNQSTDKFNESEKKWIQQEILPAIKAIVAPARERLYKNEHFSSERPVHWSTELTIKTFPDDPEIETVAIKGHWSKRIYLGDLDAGRSGLLIVKSMVSEQNLFSRISTNSPDQGQTKGLKQTVYHSFHVTDGRFKANDTALSGLNLKDSIEFDLIWLSGKRKISTNRWINSEGDFMHDRFEMRWHKIQFKPAKQFNFDYKKILTIEVPALNQFQEYSAQKAHQKKPQLLEQSARNWDLQSLENLLEEIEFPNRWLGDHHSESLLTTEVFGDSIRSRGL